MEARANPEGKRRPREDARKAKAEDLDTARLVTRFQAGDREAFATLYTRYFDRVFAYLRVVFKSTHDAEDVAQQVFVEVLEGLHRYEHRGRPFRAWLFTVVRNQAITQLHKLDRLEVLDPAELDRRRANSVAEEPELTALNWITDPDLLTFIERVPLPQRQVLVLRYMLDLTTAETARVLGHSPEAVRMEQSRAIAFLRERLKSVGREPKGSGDRTPSQQLVPQSQVLRTRRFGLSSPGPTG